MEDQAHTLIKEKIHLACEDQLAEDVDIHTEAFDFICSQINASINSGRTQHIAFQSVLDVDKKILVPHKIKYLLSWPETVWEIIRETCEALGAQDLSPDNISKLIDEYAWSKSLEGLNLDEEAKVEQLHQSVRQVLSGYGLPYDPGGPSEIHLQSMHIAGNTAALTSAARKGLRRVNMVVQEYFLRTTNPPTTIKRFVFPGFPRPPENRDPDFYVIQKAFQCFYEKQGRFPESVEAWQYFYEEFADIEGLKRTMDRGEQSLQIADKKLGREAFLKRYSRYINDRK